VCDTLSFDPAYIRRGVVQAEQRLREAQREEKCPQGARPKKLKPNLKSTTRWRVRARTVGG
ncbi:MAG: hypothetical protein ACREPG_09435, partial [Candidatus Binatia bacterium]